MEFKIKLAEHIVGIRAKYDYIQELCGKYVTKAENADFWIEMNKEDEETYSEVLERFGADFVGVDKNAGIESAAIFSKLEEVLVKKGETFIHSAVCAVDGVGYGFSAPSGTGKTTHMLLWKKLLGDRCEIINGDHPLISVRESGIYASGTPWCGKEGYSENKSVPIRAIAFIEQSKENKIEKLTASEAEKRLYYSVLLSPKMTKNIIPMIKVIGKMSRCIDFYLLKCNMNIDAAELSYNIMSGGNKNASEKRTEN